MTTTFDPILKRWRYQNQLFCPQVWLGSPKSRPAVCNCQVISLDCSARSQLRWEEDLEHANACCAQGVLIFWQLNTGIFQEDFSSPDEGTLNSALRGLEHFTRAIWPQFAGKSLCCALMGGKVPPLAKWSWRELRGFVSSFPAEKELQLALRELEISASWEKDLPSTLRLLEALNLSALAVDYQFDLLCSTWRALASVLPESAPAGIALDLTDLTDDHQLRLTTSERMEYLLPIARTHISQLTSLGWNRFLGQGALWPETEISQITSFKWSRLLGQGTLWLEADPQKQMHLEGAAISLALGLPGIKSAQSRWQALAKASQMLEKSGFVYRIVPVLSLREQWQELDFVITTFEPEGSLGRRQLEGFCAAGGMVLNVEEPMDLECELPFGAWLDAMVEGQ